MNSVYVVLRKNVCCYFVLKIQQHKITQNVSDFCNHGNQMNQPSAIMQNVKCSNENMFYKHKKTTLNNVYIA